MKSKTSTEKYLEKAKLLSNDEAERVLARMRGRFTRRVEDKRISALEAIALQLEHEDEELAQWRERMVEIRSNYEMTHKGVAPVARIREDVSPLN